jgi:hypothetical protein
VNAADRLAVLLDDPEIRETVVALDRSVPGGLRLPDLLDALASGGELLPATDLAADIALDDRAAGAFGH